MGGYCAAERHDSVAAGSDLDLRGIDSLVAAKLSHDLIPQFGN
jgi:hypothetical protein